MKYSPFKVVEGKGEEQVAHINRLSLCCLQPLFPLILLYLLACSWYSPVTVPWQSAGNREDDVRQHPIVTTLGGHWERYVYSKFPRRMCLLPTIHRRILTPIELTIGNCSVTVFKNPYSTLYRHRHPSQRCTSPTKCACSWKWFKRTAKSGRHRAFRDHSICLQRNARIRFSSLRVLGPSRLLLRTAQEMGSRH